MTNFEWLLKEKTELVKRCLASGDNFAVDRNGEIHMCRYLNCNDCIFSKPGCDCTPAIIDWFEAERNPYTIPLDTPIDTKVLVSASGTEWHKRYFAGFDDSGENYCRPYCTFDNGATSWSNCRETTHWRYCKLAAEEGEKQ